MRKEKYVPKRIKLLTKIPCILSVFYILSPYRSELTIYVDYASILPQK